MPTQRERVCGGIWGLLVGDAFGMPYEFNSPDALPSRPLLTMTPPASFCRTYPSIPFGTWTDDGATALCLLASLLHRDGLDLEDLGERFCRWLEEGYCAVAARVFDVGHTTQAALARVRQGIPAAQAGGTDNYSCGNGSLMRVLPLAVWHEGTDAELVEDAHQQSLVTHAHPHCQICCALYCLWARRYLQEHPHPWNDAVATLRSLYAAEPSFTAFLEKDIQPDKPAGGNGRGHVIDCLHSARWAVEQGSYPDVIRHAVSLGNDTDTTACVAGGIAGVRDGLEAIPADWRATLRGQEILEPLLRNLLCKRGLAS